MDYKACRLCPRECGVDRNLRRGFCGAPGKARIAKADLHRWEEPCICASPGSGAVFFSGCQLQCVFCQNFEISSRICGKAFSVEELTDLFLFLQNEKKACNLNLVSPTPYLPSIVPALEQAKARGLSIPVVFNSGGYEKIETLEKLEGLVDIYLPDLKFCRTELSRKYAAAPDYFAVARRAIREMQRQTGKPQWENEALKSGVIVRHLVLPGESRDSLEILNALFEDFGRDGVVLSLMSQYFPTHRAKEFPALSRKITRLEYQKVVRHAETLGFETVYTQGFASASAAYVPDFDWKTEKE